MTVLPYTALTIFSVLGLAGLFFMKITEIRSGKTSFLSRLSAKGDPIIRHYLDYVYGMAQKLRHENVLVFISRIFALGLHGIITFRELLSGYSRKALEAVRGKKFLKSNATVSFFLKSILEEKDKLRKK